MTYPDPDPRIARPIEVEVKNWPDNGPAKPPLIKKTTVRTFIIDPANVAGPSKVQVTDYEPNRIRMVVIPIDAPVSILTSGPTSSPDTSLAGFAPPSGGAHLPVTAEGIEFFGSDAFWLNSLNVITRVSVIREYTN